MPAGHGSGDPQAGHAEPSVPVCAESISLAVRASTLSGFTKACSAAMVRPAPIPVGVRA
jgi:hypothetical protein